MALEKTFNLARKDEIPQQFTSAEMTEIKNAISTETANVNIVLYKVYDEDGEEIVVGDVRKTISGVKKKKPLYQKRFSFTSSSTSGNWQRESIGASVDEVISQMFFVIRNDGTVYAMNNMTGTGDIQLKGIMCVGTEYSTDSNEKNAISVTFNHNVFLGQPVYGTLEYTKTTDSWEEVE